MKIKHSVTVTATALTVLLGSSTGHAKPKCDISQISILPDVKITSVSAENGPASHCKVAGIIGTETNFELLLPNKWNGKFVMGGGGGFVGSVVNVALLFGPLQRGYATVGTDTGHQAHSLDASWALNNLERIVNFGHVAVHRTAVTAKALIAKYYGRKSSKNYFYGCSRGGGQALMEAQRYPEDFDGIVAGAPAYNWTVELGARNARINQIMYPNSKDLSVATITPEAQKLIGEAVMKKCDALDGLKDGIINNPPACKFDVSTLACRIGKRQGCLSRQQVRAAKAIYDDVVIDGKRVFPGYPVGGELSPTGWFLWVTGGLALQDEVIEFQEGARASSDFPEPKGPNAHFLFGNGVMKYLVFHDPDWDYSKYDFKNFWKDTAAVAQTLNATSPDLDDFRARGGKLLIHNGWSDMALSANGTIEYYNSVLKRAPAAHNDVRLFLLPGMDHCAGGVGPDWVDYLGEIDKWVASGQAPERLKASWLDKQRQPDGSRPVCAYPKHVKYKGDGDPRDAASFTCSD